MSLHLPRSQCPQGSRSGPPPRTACASFRYLARLSRISLSRTAALSADRFRSCPCPGRDRAPGRCLDRRRLRRDRHLRATSARREPGTVKSRQPGGQQGSRTVSAAFARLRLHLAYRVMPDIYTFADDAHGLSRPRLRCLGSQRSRPVRIDGCSMFARTPRRTLNPQVRGSSPWRRTRDDLGFHRSRSFLYVRSGAVSRPCLLAACSAVGCWGRGGSSSFDGLV